MNNIVLILSLLLISFTLQAGDLGGGGTIGQRPGTTLTQKQKQKLLETGSEEGAFAVWLSDLDEENKTLALKKVFEEKVLPQLISQ